MRTCPACGHSNPVESKFCAECGAALRDPSAVDQEVRKTVTVLFCDVTGSTALAESSDPETVRRVMSRYFEETKRVLESHGGTVEKFIGDAVMAVFGIPQVHEDDALRAVRAALDIRGAMRALNDDLEHRYSATIAIRTGINTGEVVAGDPAAGQALVTGDAVNVAARLEQAALPDEILIGATTHRLVRDAVEVESVEPLTLKGKSEPVPAFRVVSADPTATGPSRRLDSPLVGREKELARLMEAFGRARSDARCELCTVIGTAGLGKSRLTAEFLARLSDTRTVNGRCLPYGDGITFWPILEIITQLAGLRDDDAPDDVGAKLTSYLMDVEHSELIRLRIAGLIGLEESASSVEETFWAVRRFLEAGARDEPLIVVVDDIHWAEPTLLDLLEYVANGSVNTPIFLLTMARPELLDVRPTWARSVPDATTIVLEPISPAESDALLQNLLGPASFPQELKERIVEAAEGTPLFVEEMFSMLVDDGKLASENGRWVQKADLSRIEVPPTIQALLSARLDRLATEERQVLGCASVAGKTFWGGAVSSLWSGNGASATPHLMSLVRKNLIQPDDSTLAGQDAFRFRHILIRDAAYEALSKEKRIELHHRFADWIVQASGDRAREYDEIVAYHLETAVAYSHDLGPLSDEATAMAGRAAELLTEAGVRADERGDLPAASNLLTRALALTGSQERRVEILLELVRAHLAMGMFPEASEDLERARAENAIVQDRRLGVLIRLEEAAADLAMTESGTAEGLAATAHGLLPELEELGDERALGRAWWLIGYSNGVFCRAGPQIEALDRAVAHFRRAGDVLQEIDARWWCAFALTMSPLTPARTLEEAERMLAALRGRSRLVEVAELIVQAHVNVCRGEMAAAVEAHLRSRAITFDLGYLVLSWSGAMETSWILQPFGEYERALEILTEANEKLAQLKETGYRSTVLMEMASALYELERFDEAAEKVDEVERMSWPDDIVNQVLSRGVRGKLLAREGKADEAISVSRAAIEIYDRVGSDFVLMRGRALLDLSETYRLLGSIDEARAAAAEALAVWETKEHVPWSKRAREHLELLDVQRAER